MEVARAFGAGAGSSRSSGLQSSKGSAISHGKSQEEDRMAVGLLKAMYQHAQILFPFIYAGLCFSKPSVILLLEQGKEPWMVSRELAKGLCPGE
ncbi:hypothetical protein MC885_008748 [Smutsia gigantea]|nr:hypothetical protein MC885_008748 [Smutsia gigantea]